MKSKLMAVFGHYDSRGGTTAIGLPDPATPADVKKTFDEYDRMFGVEEEVAQYEKNPDAWDFNPGDEAHRPSHQDFMFVARLHYPDDADIAGDLEEQGVVLIDEATEVDYGELPTKDMDGGPYHGDWTTEHKLSILLPKPTQLEFVPLGMGKYEYEEQFENLEGTLDHIERVKNESLRKLAQVLKGDRVVDRSWNDDAFGFMIGTGE